MRLRLSHSFARSCFVSPRWVWHDAAAAAAAAADRWHDARRRCAVSAPLVHTEIEVRNAAQRWRHIKMHFKNQAILCRGLFFHDFHRRKKKLGRRLIWMCYSWPQTRGLSAPPPSGEGRLPPRGGLRFFTFCNHHTEAEAPTGHFYHGCGRTSASAGCRKTRCLLVRCYRTYYVYGGGHTETLHVPSRKPFNRKYRHSPNTDPTRLKGDRP